MQHLYGVSFKGKMLYFTGSISDDRVKEVEEIAKTCRVDKKEVERMIEIAKILAN